MKGIKEINDLKDKKVVLRVDFDVPVVDEKVRESFRITKQKPMIDRLLASGAKVVMVAHINSIKSFKPILPQIEQILDYRINFVNSVEQLSELDNSNPLNLLENIRQWPEEKDNDEDFAMKLSEGFDLYINNAFAESHRNYVSVSAITKFLPSYAGLLVEEETVELKKAIETSKKGKIIIMGGAKASTKVPVVKNFLDKSEKILLGGVVANDILVKRGMDMDGSIFDANFEELLSGLDVNDSRLILPEDFNFSARKILDIGPKTIEKYGEIIKDAKMVIWNGPVGLFEDEKYADGTNSIARAISNIDGPKIIGGGDTITAVDKLGLLDKFDFVSTGGGAMLAFLAGEKLPGLEVLGYYK